MAKSLRNTTIKLKVDVDYKNLKDVDKHLKDTSNEAKKYENTLDKTGKAINDVDKKQAGLSKQYKESKESVSSLKDQVDKSNKSLVEAEKAADKVTNKNKKLENSNESLGRSIDKQSKKLSAWSNDLARTSTKLDGLSKKYKDTGKSIESFSKDISQTFGAMTLAGGAAIGYSLKKAADFEQAMKDSQALMSSDEWTKYGDKLSSTVKQLGADTKYSSVETAQGLQELIKAGVDTQKIIGGGLKDSLNLATAGELDLAKAAETMSTALNAFTNDTSLTSTKAANLLAGAANASSTDVNEMSYALSQSAAVANMVNQSFESTSTALAVLAKNSLQGSDAGTSLKTMLLNLSPQTEDAARQMEALGLAQTSVTNGYNYLVKRGLKPATITYDGVVDKLKELAKVQAGEGANASKISKEYDKLVSQSGLVSSAFFTQNGQAKDMEQIFGLLQKSMKGLSEEQKINALKTMFGTDAIRAASIAAKEGKKGFQEMNNAMQEITAEDVMKEKMNTLKGSIEYAKGSIDNLVTNMGTALIPTFNTGAKAVEKLSDWFNSLNQGTKENIAKWGLIAVATTGAVAGLGFISLAISGVVTGYGKMLSAGSKLTGWLSRNNTKYTTSARAIDAETASLSRNTSAQLANAKARGANDTAITSAGKGSKGTTFIGTPGKNGLGKVGKDGLLKTGSKLGKRVPVVGTLLAGGMLVAGGKENLGSNTGSLAGGAAGAAIGSAIAPGLGTLIGGMAGAYFGESFGESAQKSLEKNAPKVEKTLKDGLSFNKNVSKGTASAIKEYEKLNDQATEQLNLLYWNGSKISNDTAKSLKDTYNNMADTIQRSMKTKFHKTANVIADSMKDSGLSKKEQKLILKNIQTNHKARENLVKKSQDRINNILKKATKEKRKLTEHEREIINKEQDKMRSYAVKTLSKSAKEQRSIMTTLKNDSSRLSAKQAADVVKQSKKAKEGAVKEANKKYKAVVAAADAEYYDNHSITKKQHDDIIKKAKDTRDKSIDHAEKMHEGVVKQAKQQATAHIKEVDWETGQVLTKWQTFKTKLASVVNTISTGINKVLDAFGISAKIPMWSPTGYSGGSNTVQQKSGKGPGGSLAAYANGTNHHPGGLAVVGEEGPELAYTPYGGAKLVGTKGAEIADLPRGTRVLTASQTAQMMSGGLKGMMPGYAKGIGNKIGNFTSDMFDFISNPSAAIKKLIAKHSIGHDMMGLGAAALEKIRDSAVDFMKDKMGDIASIGAVGGAGAAQARKWIMAAMSITGTPMSYLNGLMTIAKRESGFNPKAINLWDSNAKAGHPSQGLFQTIPSTFAAHRNKSLPNDITNPIANAVAAINYMNSRYGGIGNVPGLRNLRSGKGYVGYAKGGFKNNHDKRVLVGEEGPELVDLPFGSQVHNNRKTNDLLNKKDQVVINFNPVINVKVEGKTETTESAIERAVNKALEAAFKDLRGLFDSGVAY